MKKYINQLIILVPFIIIFAIVLGCVSGPSSYSNNSSSGNTSNSTNGLSLDIPEEVIECDVRDLIDALEDNPLRASETYKGQYLKVVGYLSNVDASGKYFNLDAGSKSFDFTNLQFYIKTDDVKNEIIDCSKGDLLEVTCSCKDVGEILGYSFDAIKVGKKDKAKPNDNDRPSSGNEDNGIELDEIDDSAATLGEKNALASAKDHLKYSFYSKNYLKKMLEYDEFTSEEINYAIEKIDPLVDWKEQAVGIGREHLDCSPYSKEYLKTMLEYDEFTQEEIDYAIEIIDSEVDWKEQAVQVAREHLKCSPYSKNYLKTMLEYDKFTQEEVDYAIEIIDLEVDWKEQAAKAAKEFSKGSTYSKSELLDLLKYDGFTSEQAQYGVDNAEY